MPPPPDLRKAVNRDAFKRRSLPTLFSILICLCFAASPAFAQTKTAPASPQIVGDADTQLIVDTEHHTVRIMIDGREAVLIDAKGMHVRDRVFADTFVNAPQHAAQPEKQPEQQKEKGQKQ